MFEKDWVSLSFMALVFLGITLLIILLIRAFYSEFTKWTKIKFRSLETSCHQLHRKYGVLLDIFKKLRGNELSYSVDVFFQLFSHFYDSHFEEFDHWGWDKHLFPEGRRDMSDMYRWIKKIRIDNYAEANNVVQSNGRLEYWGVPYKGFKFRINSKDELVITPHDDEDKFIFEKVTMRMYNALYALDTKKCLWILERRKFFGF